MTTTQAVSATDPWAQAHRPVVVAVDGSDGSRSALAWAAGDAAAAGADLRIVTAAPRHRARAERYVERLAHDVAADRPDTAVAAEVYEGHPQHAVLAHLDETRLLVVGKRGLGAIPRLLVGSTSLALAGHSPVPVAVVPTGWDQSQHTHQPVVLGLDPDRPHHHLVHLAFHRAQRLGVPLVAVHGTETLPRFPESDPQVDVHLDDEPTTPHERFTAELARWTKRFPAVEVRSVATPAHPAMAILAEAESGAQLVVLGRHFHQLGGFGFGSVTRAVLHYAEVPVLVVPDGADEV